MKYDDSFSLGIADREADLAYLKQEYKGLQKLTIQVL